MLLVFSGNYSPDTRIVYPRKTENINKTIFFLCC